MSLAEVLAVLDAVRSVGCHFWIEGGWGVDALVGQQTTWDRGATSQNAMFDSTFVADRQSRGGPWRSGPGNPAGRDPVTALSMRVQALMSVLVVRCSHC
jgi:hypothetical protein